MIILNPIDFMKVFYRKLDKYLLVLTFLCFLASCSSSKRIAYLQDLSHSNGPYAGQPT